MKAKPKHERPALPKRAAAKKRVAAKRPPAKRKPPLEPQKLTAKKSVAAKQPAHAKQLTAKQSAQAKKKSLQAKPAPKKLPVKPKVLTMRGSGLVELAIAADRERRQPNKPPRPLTRAQIDQLAMPDGKEIPRSLATWLAYDTLDIFEGTKAAPRLRWRSFVDMMREQFDDDTAKLYADFGKLLTGQCLVVPGGSDSRRFMYAGTPDAHGEYPIFIVDTDELPWVGLAYPGFDAYIADGLVANVITDTYMDAWQHAHWAPHLEHHARTNFGGFKALDYQDPEHVDGAPAAKSAMAEILGDLGDLSLEDFGEAG